MKINFHIVLAKSFLEKIHNLQTFCNDFGFDVSFNSEDLQKKLSQKTTILNIKYRNKITSPEIYLATISDVKDICDDICSHLKEEYDVAIVVDFNGNNLAATYRGLSSNCAENHAKAEIERIRLSCEVQRLY